MKHLTCLISLFLAASSSFAIGEASTYFEIFVPPNNNAVHRDVSLIVTALYDSTTFEIIDDDMDGDSDDSVSGMLMAGQSYVLYIRDGAVNDDAAHRGERGAKQDGDFFIVTSSKLVVASQSTNSDWQHDWVPATNKSSKGTRFIVYAPYSHTPRDLNVYAYEDSTYVTIKEISIAPHLSTGYTQVNIQKNQVVAQRMIHVGEDLIYYHTEGQDVMTPGGTYLIETNKAVTVQYGALHGNARDGGGYVPSDNGSSSGELFYFTVHYQGGREQEIRIVSWDDANEVSLDYFDRGTWRPVEAWDLQALEPGDWVSYTGNIQKVFRVRCTPGKKVSVFEANWLETGAPGTSDIASMVSSRDGTTAGKAFLVYVPPPGYENNVTDPFTGKKIGTASHVYLFSRDTARVTVKDAKTQGEVFLRTYTLLPGTYADCAIYLQDWRDMYNGNGDPNAGPDRPYLLIEADRPISAFNTNFNDNWMTYFGTSQTQDFGLRSSSEEVEAAPGDSVRITSQITFNDNAPLEQTEVEVIVGGGATVISSEFVDETEETTVPGKIAPVPGTDQTKVTFEDLPPLQPEKAYSTDTEVFINGNYPNGDPIPTNTVVTVETVVSGEVNGNYQQASSSVGLNNETANRALPRFFPIADGSPIVSDAFDNLGVSFADFNNDGFQDLFVAGYGSIQPSLLYKNNGNRSFERLTEGALATDLGRAASSTWADYDNDGDLDVFVANIGSRNGLYLNNGDGTFTKELQQLVAKYSGQCFNASWVDYDNDGLLDLFVAEFITDQPNLLYHNEGNGELRPVNSAIVFPNARSSLGATWADYDGDGDLDVFIPNTHGENNQLYRNEGGGVFTEITEGEVVNDGGNSVGSSWADYDNDGDLDLFVANSDNQSNFLYENRGDGTFARVQGGAIANDKGKSQGSAWGDLDNDGDLDLYVTNSLDETYYLYWNRGDGTFVRDDHEPPVRSSRYSLAAAMADIDNDGDLDLFVANHEGGANALYLNNSKQDNHWIQVKLVGTRSNRSAVGAKLRVKATIDGAPSWQLREIAAQTGGGAGSQNSLIAHLGLGDAQRIDSIIVEWPSGYRQFETDVSVDQLYVIVEEEGTLVSGRVYMDADSSCSYTPGEQGIPSQLIEINPGSIFVSTDTAGRYRVRLHEGHYTFAQRPTSSWTQLCPEGPATYELHVQPEGGVPTPVYHSASSFSDCSWGCTNEPGTSFGNTLTIGRKDHVCIPEGSSFNGRVRFNGGGTLVICGIANISEIDYNGQGTVIVSESGILNLGSLALTTPKTMFIHYGTQTNLGGITDHKGVLENHGRLSLGDLAVDLQGSILNTGDLALGACENQGVITNYGSLTIHRSLTNLAAGTFANHCRLNVSENLDQFGAFTHHGDARVQGSSTFHNRSESGFRAGTRFVTTDLTVDEQLTGPEQAGALLEVSGISHIEPGAILNGHLDICDANGVERFLGVMGTFATFDCALDVPEAPCDDGLLRSAYVNYDFGNAPSCNDADLTATLGTTALRRGFENDFIITVRNDGPAEATDVRVEVKLDRYLIPRRSNIPWDTAVYRSAFTILSWVLPKVPALGTKLITLTDSVDVMTPFGVFATTRVTLSHGQADCEPGNNEVFSTDEIVGAFDPNDKQVSPQGFGREHYVLETDTLHYKIRFQNVGNFYASRVVIYDTLSSQLDWTTFIPGSMSHDGYVVMSEHGVLVWTFDNIYLPDSNANEPESHGFVTFSILPKADLSHGTRIENQAAIQFDYNEYIYTNVVHNTIARREDLQDDYLLGLRVFPNPVTTESIIMVAQEEDLLPVKLEKVEILSADGRQVALLEHLDTAAVPLQTEGLLPGVYILRAWDIHGFTYLGRMVVGH